MLSGIGYEFFDENGKKLPAEFASLGKVRQISADNVRSELKECRLQIACDVTNPLCGPQGCVYIFGPQKGVKEEEKEKMDQDMEHYARCLEAFQNKQIHTIPGTGAAGGLGFAFLWGLWNVELKSGIDIVLEAIGLKEELEDADIVVTGEGRLDVQTAMGKVPVGVAKLAKQYGCKVIAFAGSVTDDAKKCNESGIDAFFPILRSICSLEEAMDPANAVKNMRDTSEQVFRLLNTGRNI
jgi:glycerate kinase